MKEVCWRWERKKKGRRKREELKQTLHMTKEKLYVCTDTLCFSLINTRGIKEKKDYFFFMFKLSFFA